MYVDYFIPYSLVYETIFTQLRVILVFGGRKILRSIYRQPLVVKSQALLEAVVLKLHRVLAILDSMRRQEGGAEGVKSRKPKES